MPKPSCYTFEYRYGKEFVTYQWQLKDYPAVCFQQNHARQWAVVLSKSYLYDADYQRLQQAGFPVEQALPDSLRSIATQVAEVMGCTPHLIRPLRNRCYGHKYTVGNTGFYVFKVNADDTTNSTWHIGSDNGQSGRPLTHRLIHLLINGSSIVREPWDTRAAAIEALQTAIIAKEQWLESHLYLSTLSGLHRRLKNRVKRHQTDDRPRCNESYDAT